VKADDDEHARGDVLQENIRALIEARTRFERNKTREQRIADAITGFAGSMPFVYFHAFLFGAWLLINTGVLPFIEPFDPFPFVMLAMVASVEAIFLSTFVLVSQNRMQALADRRADLNLQISLLAERETTTMLVLLRDMAGKLGIQQTDPQLDELAQIVKPQDVLEHIENAQADEMH
jgi:uncharacterized membrane protein